MCIAFCLAAAIAASAQSVYFTTLVNFNGADGAGPEGALVQGTDGNFYGATDIGGNYAGNCQSSGQFGCGTVFKMTPAGTLTRLYSFCSQPSCSDGALPVTALVRGTDGNFYGTTWDGGANPCGTYGCGTVYKITPEGTFTTVHSFCAESNCSDGSHPVGGLVQGRDGSLYGTTEGGGGYGYGTVFKITPVGALTTLYSFCAAGWPCPDGWAPDGPLVQGTDGNFYGTTYMGGTNEYCFGGPGDASCGTVFKITPTGALTTLYSFCSQPNCADGFFPAAGLVQATDGNFYGTTQYGGTNLGVGTVFRITATGTLTTLYTFCSQSGCTDGAGPQAGLLQTSDGNFYGTTGAGGAYQGGTVFQITATGTLTTLHSFGNGEGVTPIGDLVQAADGSFYGATWQGGVSFDGTIFRIGMVHTCATCQP